MTPEETQKVHDWVEVREALLARVASLDPKLANNQNIRPMYAHLLVALRRATITIIRIVADREGTEDGRGAAVDGDGQTEENACFGWMGLNYFTKICEDTAFLDGVDELQNYFGVTFKDNPLLTEETLHGEDARREHNARGSRWGFPPRRRSFFGGLDKDTVKFAHHVLRRALQHGKDHNESLGTGPDKLAQNVSNISVACNDGVVTQTRVDTADTVQQATSSMLQRRPPVNMHLVHEFRERTAARRRATMLTLALRGWSSLTIRLRETRATVNLRWDTRQRVSDLAAQKNIIMALRKHVAAKRHAREAANNLLDGRRVAAARALMTALATNLERGRALEQSVYALRAKVESTWARRAKSTAITAMRQACNDARVVNQRAEEMRTGALTRLSIETFSAWATAGGLAGHLRKRLGRVDRTLLNNAMSAWALFSQHLVDKRLQREKRAETHLKRARVRAWDTEVLGMAFSDWANATAAAKFRRLRLSACALRGWQAVARASVAGNRAFQLSQGQHEARLTLACREAEARFDRASHKRMSTFFESWAREAGLASRLRRRLGNAETALVRNVFRALAIFARHSIRKRDARLEARAAKKVDHNALQGALWAWADVTAAQKFCRMRLRHRFFVAWSGAVFIN